MKTVPASLQDAEGIAIAHVSAWQKAYRGIVSDKFLDAMRIEDRITRWREILQDPACKLLVAKQTTETLGFVSFGRSREPNAKTTDGEIWTMYVCPSSWRGPGAHKGTSAVAAPLRQGAQ